MRHRMHYKTIEILKPVRSLSVLVYTARYIIMFVSYTRRNETTQTSKSKRENIRREGGFGSKAVNCCYKQKE